MNNTGTFSAVGQQSAILSLAPGDDAEIVLALTGSHPYTIDLVRMTSGDFATEFVRSFSADTPSTRWTNSSPNVVRLRLQCKALDSSDSETLAYALRNTAPRSARNLASTRVIGADAEWSASAGDDPAIGLGLARGNAGKVVYFSGGGVHLGDRIVGAYVLGLLNAASTKHTTVLLEIRKVVASVGGNTDSSIAVMSAAVDVQANTVLGESNSRLELDYTLQPGESCYAQVTVTTTDDAACGAEIDGVVFQVIQA